MSYLAIAEHALKHGLDENQITHAWKNAVVCTRIARKDGLVDYVAVGPDQNGRIIEMTGRAKDFGILIYHANTPPTTRSLRTLNLQKRKRRLRWKPSY
ncbi:MULTISPECIES: hypothetical protein [unclassified Adlercreutzia]|uniref:hypothetical protein n=1 Tax=unclassified Adlercreutzia TaxID=2636013 RepID=UPI0013EA1DAE|nr:MULTISPECIES: hypothetical protein [unclassified Adlercreutzia]